MDSEESSSSEAHERTPFGLLSRTWELELFISGALVFALMQAPAHLDAIWQRVVYDLEPLAFQITLMAYIYGRCILLVLILAFLLNLGARAYWVGLMGVDSVFPRGIRWDRSHAGPITRGIYGDRIPETRRLIRLLDNFCSVTFSFAFVLVVLFVFSVALFAVIGGIVFVLTRLTGREQAAPLLTIIVMLSFAALITAAGLIDRYWGERLVGRRSGRILRRVIHATALLQLLPLYGSTFMTLMTNLRARVVIPAMYALMFGVIFGVFADLIGEEVELTGDRFLPAHAASVGVDYEYYDSHRPAGAAASALPRIQADIIREPYVRLVIPYNARRDNRAIERLCPETEPLVGGPITMDADATALPDPAALDAVLTCIAGYRDIRLDGQPLPDLSLRFFRDPTHGLEGTVAYLPAHDLAPGEHVITINRTPRWDDDAPPGAPPRKPDSPYTIRFWR